MGIKFVPFNRRENRRSLAIFFAEEIAHLGALKIARFCGGAVKIAAATAENRAILVHSALVRGSGSKRPAWQCFQPSNSDVERPLSENQNPRKFPTVSAWSAANGGLKRWGFGKSEDM